MSRDIKDVPIIHFGSPVGSEFRRETISDVKASLKSVGWISNEEEDNEE
jgi:hypothetical protein